MDPGGGGGGHSGTEGGGGGGGGGRAPSLRISRKKGYFLRPPHVRDFVKEGYFFVPRFEVWGSIHEIYASDSRSDWASESAATTCCR